ncbi:MAG: OmpA family protein [Vicinamibacteria bacterium]
MRSALLLAFVALVPLGCATKKHVGREIGEVSERVATLSADVERTQARTTLNEARIEEVDRSASAGVRAAQGSAREAALRAADAERQARGKLLYTLSLSSDELRFGFAGASLDDGAKRLLDEYLAPLVADNRGVFLELEGHTDATGPESYNRRLGEQRALAVRDYLHDQLGIALNRMAVISYGSSKPLVDNRTLANRAQNRRVVIKVVE